MDNSTEIPLTPAILEYMLVHLVRRQRVFSQARTILLPQHFDPATEQHYSAIWATTLKYYEQYSSLPNKETLGALVVGEMQRSAYGAPEMLSETLAVVEWMFSAYEEDGDFDDSCALGALRDFLVDRDIKQRMREALVPVGRRGGPLPQVLQQVQDRLSRIQSLQGQSISLSTIPDTWSRPEVELIPSGITLFDSRMGGGNYPGDINVLLAPTGVGKTMVAVQIACSRAQSQLIREAEKPGSGKVTVLFSFEEPAVDVHPRVIACAAEIDKTRAERMRSYDDLSRTGNLLEYEQRRFRSQLDRGFPVPGEYERLMACRTWVNPFLHVADFSGIKQPNGDVRGHGGIPEMRAYLDRLVHETGRQIDTVIVDWAGQCEMRAIEAEGGDLSRKLTINLTTFIDRLHVAVSAPYGCPTWVMHQLSADCNGISPSARLTHANALQCGSFAVHAYYAFVLGNKDEHTSTCLLRCTKSRRTEQQGESICRIDGAFGRLVPADNFMIDPVTRGIISNAESRRFTATPTQTVSSPIRTAVDFGT